MKKGIRGVVDPRWLKSILDSANNRAEGCHRLSQIVVEGLAQEKFTADNFSYRQLGLVLGVIDPFDEEGSVRAMAHEAVDLSRVRPDRLFHESNPGLLTNAFQTVTQELISSKVLEGYNMDYGYIGDSLVTVMPSRMRNQRIAGFTSIDGPEEVREGHPYPETGFEDKFVMTAEAKKGRILRISEELLLFDQTGEINRRAMNFGHVTRQERERTIVRGVVDADAPAGRYVYRPSGSGQALYAGANKNYIGSGSGITGYDSAVVLTDWTSLDTVLTYRATEVMDDRVDGQPHAIAGLNGPQNLLLVPESKRSTAVIHVTSSGGQERTNSGNRVTDRHNPISGFVRDVVSSPFLDEMGADGKADWYYGDFARQFVWTEIWPIQSFMQGRDSEGAFLTDTVLAVKVRYYGGINATDTPFVTKIDGA